MTSRRICSVRDSAIALWILEVLGHDKVHILNGGIDAWKNAGFSLSQKPTRSNGPATFREAVAQELTSRISSMGDCEIGKSIAS